MKRIYLLGILGLMAMPMSAQDVITLDLSKSNTVLEFNEQTGAWVGTFDDDEESIDSQCFNFIHSSMSSYSTWWGFTASNSADNSVRDNYVTYQYSNMAKGGIALNDDGSVKMDEFGAPVVSADMPYLVAFYSPFMSRRPVTMTFEDSKSYEAVGVYVSLNSWTFYSLLYGDSFARAFTNGDKYTLTIHGVAPDETEKEVEVTLGSFSNGDLTASKGWKYVDLTSLGVVNELYFTIKSTDSGAYGDNTPAYFCLDKLMVKEDTSSAVAHIASSSAVIKYDRASKTVSVSGADFSAVYDSAGRKVMATEASEYSLESLSAGIYVIKAGNSSIKIAK